MNNFKLTFFCILLVGKALTCFSQTREIKIGDQVPNLAFSQIFNYKSDSLKFSDFKGKYIILDFWGTNCGSCLEEFPRLDTLQKKYGDRIQIIPVTRDKKDDLGKFFKTHKHVRLLNTPYITADKSLEALFPHTGVPFQAFIDPAGKLIQLSSQFTENNLQYLLDSGKVNFRRARKNIYVHTLIDSRWDSMVTYSSVILKYNFASGLHIEGPNHGKGIAYTGSVKELFLRAYSDSINERLELDRPGRVIFNAADPSIYHTEVRGEAYIQWLNKNGYAYQLRLPENSKEDPFELMKNDLDRYFQLTSEIKKTPINCYVLKRTSGIDKLKTKGGEPKGQNALQNYSTNYFLTGESPKVREIVNEPFSLLAGGIQRFVEYGLIQPFVDDSGYMGNIDFTIDGKVIDSNNLELWNKALKKYYLEIVQEKRELNVLVISEKKH